MENVVALFALLVVVFGLTTGEFVIAGILPDVAAGLGVPLPAAGLLVTAYAVGMIVGGPVVTVATARVPRRPLVTALVVVAVLGNVASALAPGYATLLVARFVSGLVVATFFAVGVATAFASAPPGREASAVARLTVGLNLGIVLGAPLGTLVGQHLGWRATFVTVAVVVVLGLALVLRFVPAGPAAATGSVLGELRVLADRDVQLAVLLTAAGNVGAVMVFTYLAPLLTTVAGFALGAVPFLLLAYGAGAVLGNVLGGGLADRALLPALAGLLVALAVTLGLLRLLGGLAWPAAALTFVLGLLAFAIVPGMQTRVVTAAGRAPTLAVAVNASGFQLAAAFAGWLGGRVIDGAGAANLPAVGAALTVGGVLVALAALHRDRRRSAVPSR